MANHQYDTSRAIMKKYQKNGVDNTYQIMPDMDPEYYKRLKTSIEKFGVLDPVIIDQWDHILDGHHRVQICAELGITDFNTIIMLPGDEKSKLEIIRDLNTARRHLTREQFRELIEMELIADPELSDRRMAEKLGVDHKTIGAARTRLEQRGEIPHVETVTDTQGRQQPRERVRTVYNEGTGSDAGDDMERDALENDPVYKAFPNDYDDVMGADSSDALETVRKYLETAAEIIESTPANDYLFTSEGLKVVRWKLDVLMNKLAERKPGDQQSPET